MTPDCADNPYFLRAYFAWKLGLPFGFHETGWGTVDSPPRAGRFITADAPPPSGNPVPVASVRRLLNQVKNTVHAGSGRTALRADGTDYYPLPLSRRALRPGTVYADPYGHTYTLVRWVAQTRKSPGLLLGVDAQPDGTIGVKRFWKGNFLFTTEDVVGEPGFKAFRPVVVESGRPRLSTNREIAASPDYGDFSLQQEKIAGADFYAVMEKLINPEPLDAEAAFDDLFRALHEQLLVRVDSVRNGEAYMKAHPGTVIPMPSGKSVFQSLGQWEDYSTPNRDLRLLIAIDTILEFPDKVAADPAAYEMGRKVAGRDPSRAPRPPAQMGLVAHDHLWGIGRLVAHPDARGHLPQEGRLRDGLQPQRQHRDPLGRTGGQRRARDGPAPLTGVAGRQDEGPPALVPQAPSACCLKKGDTYKEHMSPS